MAWPFDARDISYIAGRNVPSSNLNAIQDRIVDLHRDRVITTWIALPHLDASNNREWNYSPVAVGPWWFERGGAGFGQDIFFPLQAPHGGMILKSARVKYRTPTVNTLSLSLYTPDVHFDVAATAPALGAADATVTPAGATAVWLIATLTPGAPVTVDSDHYAIVRGHNSEGNDEIAGVEWTFQPLTPTP